MRIGIAIPCYKYHIPVLKNCLDSIEAQTIHPSSVVVSCSSSAQSDIPEYSYSFPLKILVHEGRKNAAQNRNIAAASLDTDLLSFFDADDTMHPQRLEYIRDSFRKEPCNIVLHSFLEKEETTKPFVWNTAPIVHKNVLRRAPSGCVILEGNQSARIHHSQSTVDKSVLSKVQFKEDTIYERREDAIFCGDVLSLPDIQSVYLGNQLSKYYMEGVWH
jgi:glycosyltransferase involved in cell wall biosynthesis